MISKKSMILVSFLLGAGMILLLIEFFSLLKFGNFLLLLALIVAPFFIFLMQIINLQEEKRDLKLMVASLKLEKDFLETEKEKKRMEEDIEKISREFEEMLEKNKGKIIYH